MSRQELSIGETAKILGVNVQTLRRWDQAGFLISQRRPSNRRFYLLNQLELEVQQGKFDLKKMARAWAFDDSGWQPLDSLYCPTSPVFQVRLQALERQLQTAKDLTKFFQLISATAGEIGNNSFDHNLGNWSDIPGIFFGFNIQKRYIVLADRGQGILTTLQRVRPSLATHHEALGVAFTEVLTGRSPEHRGNGLKFVKKIVWRYHFELEFQTGDAILTLTKSNKNLATKKTKKIIKGCLAIITF